MLLLQSTMNFTQDYPINVDTYNRTSVEFYILITWSVCSFTIAIIGNIVILLAVFFSAFRIDKFSLSVIKNLAVSDIYFNLIWVLPTLVTLLNGNVWVLGELVCAFTTYLQYPPAIATIFFITILSVNKWIRCQFPLRTLDMTTALAYKITIAVWSFAFIHPTLYFVSNQTITTSDKRLMKLDYYKGSCNYNDSTYLVLYWNLLDLTCAVVYCLGPSLVLVASNIAIVKIVKRKGRGNMKMSNFFMLVAITYLFLVSYTPYTIKYLIPILKVNLNVMPDSFIVLTYYLLYINSWANVFIYFFTNHSFRKFVISLMRFERHRPLNNISGIVMSTKRRIRPRMSSQVSPSRQSMVVNRTAFVTVSEELVGYNFSENRSSGIAQEPPESS